MNSNNYDYNLFNGFRVVIRDPYPTYEYKIMKKKHRSKLKKNVTPRVKVFNGMIELLKDSEFILDEVNKIIYTTSIGLSKLEEM